MLRVAEQYLDNRLGAGPHGHVQGRVASRVSGREPGLSVQQQLNGKALNFGDEVSEQGKCIFNIWIPKQRKGGFGNADRAEQGRIVRDTSSLHGDQLSSGSLSLTHLRSNGQSPFSVQWQGKETFLGNGLVVIAGPHHEDINS